MNTKEKSAISKVTAILQIVSLSILSALNILTVFAPGQKRFIATLQYIAEVIRAVLTVQPLPDIPEELKPETIGARVFATEGWNLQIEPLHPDAEDWEVNQSLTASEIPDDLGSLEELQFISLTPEEERRREMQSRGINP